jgi:hypothetical protein
MPTTAWECGAVIREIEPNRERELELSKNFRQDL